MSTNKIPPPDDDQLKVSAQDSADKNITDKTLVIEAGEFPAPDEVADKIAKCVTSTHTDTKSNPLSATGTFFNRLRSGTFGILGGSFGKDVDRELQMNMESSSAKGDVVKDEASNPMSNLLNTFSLGNKFASGGQGILSVGTDLHLGRDVAVKSMRKELLENPKLRSEFLAEAQVTAQLEHPSIVPVYSIHSDEDNGLHLVMKMIHGENFKDYLNKISDYYEKKGVYHYDETKSLRYRIEIFLQICDALEYAHSRNIMHCDLKPENIMIGEYHDAYLMDWGIAKLIKDPNFSPEKWVKPKEITGTPRFLSPEAIRGEHCDHLADIYAMGLILFEITTLSEAYTGSSAKEIMMNIAAGNRHPMQHKFGVDIRTDLKAIIARASHPEKTERYQSIKDFSSDIRKFLRGEPTMARPDNFFRRTVRFCSQHGTSMVIITLLFVLVGLSSTVSSLVHDVQRDAEVMQKHRQAELKRRVSSNAFVRLTNSLIMFDSEISACEDALDLCAKQFYFLTKSEVKIANSHLPIVYHKDFLDPAKTTKTFQFSEQTRFKCDFENIAMLKCADTRPDTLRREQCIATLFPDFKKALCGCHVMDDVQNNTQEQRPGDIISLIYFSFSDGLHFCYPGKIFDDDYDPRKRAWYQNRMADTAEMFGWNTPYLNSNGTGIVLTYSVRIPKDKEGIACVASADILVSKLIEKTAGKELSSNPSILERTFIDSNGVVIVSTNREVNAAALSDYYAKQDGGSGKFVYPDKELVDKLLSIKSGMFERKEKNRSVLITVAHCSSCNWYCFEKIDLDIAVQNELDKEDVANADNAEVADTADNTASATSAEDAENVENTDDAGNADTAASAEDAENAENTDNALKNTSAE